MYQDNNANMTYCGIIYREEGRKCPG